MERFEFFCPVHGVVANRRNMDARLDPTRCPKCDRRLRASQEGEVIRHASATQTGGLC